jgi:hypothetical protein
VAALTAGFLHGFEAAVLPVLPLLLLLVSLLLGLYPGSEAIVRLAERIATRGRAAAESLRQSRPQPPRRGAVRGGLLLARALAGRAPPVQAIPSAF